MKTRSTAKSSWLAAFLLGSLPVGVLASDVLQTDGFSTCMSGGTIIINNVDIQYSRATNKVTYDVSGSSTKSQNVTASLSVTAYGQEVYQKAFNPCDSGSYIEQICPGKLDFFHMSKTNDNLTPFLVPEGAFAATGEQTVPSSFAGLIPSIAFSIPDLDGSAKLELQPVNGGPDLACVQSTVNNGQTIEAPGISYFAAGIAGAALVLSGVSALGSAAGGGGTGAPSPSFAETMGWFQSMAMNGMLSVNYPPVYRSFTKNFAFSSGLIPWNKMQASIDNFRNATGGNLTTDSVAYLQNATLVYDESPGGNNNTKRAIDIILNNRFLLSRDAAPSTNGSSPGESAKTQAYVSGIQAFVEKLTIPQSNTFMTVLLVFAIAIAVVAVSILLFKVILETWALFGSFPKRLTGFRKRYWGLLARTIVNMILVLYGVWTLYCVYQFTHGDSWAAKVLAGVTLTAFTAILGFFTFRIWQLARKYKQTEGDSSALFEDKETWRRYSLFYDQYKKDFWWVFIPAILYMFAKGCVIAAGDGHGLAQTAGQLIIESLMLALLVWNRPYATRAGMWINIFIQIVRVLSVVCILVFVEHFHIAQSTKTITGVALIAVQSVLTGGLAILIAVNAIIICCKENPHRKRRKAAGKLKRSPRISSLC
jgi:hypothetical protein